MKKKTYLVGPDMWMYSKHLSSQTIYIRLHIYWYMYMCIRSLGYYHVHVVLTLACKAQML